jgi:hypothetical protein
MKKRLSYFPYNERSRSGWTLSTPHHTALSPIRSTIKTVTYVSGTFVTLVPGPYTLFQRGILLRRLLTPSLEKGKGEIFGGMSRDLCSELRVQDTSLGARVR